MVDSGHGTRWMDGIQTEIEDRIDDIKVILYILITCNSCCTRVRGVREEFQE